MMLPLIQKSPISEEEIINRADSAKVAWQQFTEMLAADPGTALQHLGRQAIQFGLKVLAALVIYIIGNRGGNRIVATYNDGLGLACTF